MEISEKALGVISDLIEINNDRVAGFEKAGKDLDQKDSGLIALFNKLAGESRQNVAELTGIARQYGGKVAEGTSASGALHRTWIDIKASFTDNDPEAILSECERGEDAIKSSYNDALDPENQWSPELAAILQKQQQGILAGHDLIKSLRDQVKSSGKTADQQNRYFNSSEGSAREGMIPSMDRNYEEGRTGQFQEAASNVPEPVDFEQEEAFRKERTTGSADSKLMEFFLDELKDLLWAEKELTDTLPEMAEAATSEALKTAFNNHLTETERHVTRLEQIFGIFGLEPETTKCDAMAGIVDEGDSIISNTEEGTAQRDVGLIFAGQKAEHYEIASYGGMISLAKTLGYDQVAELLSLTLDEEKAADGILTEIAESRVNADALRERSDD